MSDVDTVHGANGSGTGGPVDGRDPVPAAVDRLLAALSGLFGLVLVAVGAGLLARVDRALIAETVAQEGVEVNGLTPEQFVAAATPAIDWVAAGVVVTGLTLLGTAVVFVRARRRTRAHVSREGDTTTTFWASGVYGAVVTALVSFIPGSVIVGGATAAYLHSGDSGARVGAATDVVANALTLPLLASVAVGVLAGANAIGMLGGGAILALLVVVGGLLALTISASLGAIGGLAVTRVL